MKKEVVFSLVFSVVIIISFAYNLNADTITGNTITGNATSSNVAVSITIAGAPSLTILKPENETYFTATNLEFNFTAFSADTIKYNLDNGSNTTVTGNILFNTSSGTHTLYFFGNNSDGNTTKNVTFTVNLSKFIVHYDNYSGATKGASTDFNKSSYEDIQDLSGIVLENTNFGKINFNQAINLTNDSVYTNNDINIDNNNTNISYNFIEINATALPNLNKSATLYLYNLTFTDPRVLRNGQPCDSSICTEVSYSGGNFIFNVTQFTNYSADETPENETASGGGGGGGGGSGINIGFVLDKSQISVSLKPGEIITENITITNTGKKTTIFTIENLLQEFILRGEEQVILNPGESKQIPLYLFVRFDTVPDLYLGKVIISSGSAKKEVLIAIEVESEGILLDVRTEILDSYKKVIPGKEVLSEMRLFNLGDTVGRKKDVLLEYIIKDYDGNEISKETESLAIETQTSFIKRISIPEDSKIGNYVLYVRAIYDGKVASASDNFEIVSEKISLTEKIIVLVIFILVVMATVVVYYWKKRRESFFGWDTSR